MTVGYTASGRRIQISYKIPLSAKLTAGPAREGGGGRQCLWTFTLKPFYLLNSNLFCFSPLFSVYCSHTWVVFFSWSTLFDCYFPFLAYQTTFFTAIPYFLAVMRTSGILKRIFDYLDFKFDFPETQECTLAHAKPLRGEGFGEVVKVLLPIPQGDFWQ